MTDSELGTWLRRERERRGWNKGELVRRLIKAAREGGDTSVPDAEGVRRSVYRWEAEGGVSERYRFHYCRAFGIDVSEFGADGETGSPAPPVCDVPPQGAVLYRERGEPALDPEVVAMAANESSDHAAERDPYGIGDITLEQLRADVIRLSRQADTGSPLPTFLELRRVRDRIHLLLDRRLRHREQGDLYLILGCVNGLMGVTANQVGYPDAAEQLLRAGWAYASIIEHDPLRAMLRVKHSHLNFLRGRYSESRDLAADGLRYVSQGSPGADLHVWHARAAARLGDPDTARRALGLSDDAQDIDYNDDLLEIGGEFAISRATHHSQVGRALTDITDAERDAAAELEEAISLYDAGPGPGEEHWYAGKPSTCVDLALTRIRSGALDAAAEALESPLALPPEQRITDITNRLADVRRELAAPVFQGSPQARTLGDQIETYTREAVTSALHCLSG